VPNIRQLEYLVALADTLNFRRAAERTNTSQPTLSEQLKALEDRLGAQLVERSRPRVMLTPIGIQTVEIARRILRDANEIRAVAANGGQELSGLLRLGLPPTIGPYLLPKIIPALRANYPSLKLYLREEPPQSLVHALDEGALDVIVTLLPVASADFRSCHLFREPLHLVVGADHPLASQTSVQRSALEGQDVLTLGPQHQLHEVVHALCEEFGARLRYDFEGTSLDTLREMVVMGLGITFLPGLYVRREIMTDPSLKVLELHGRSLYRTVGMVWRKTSARQTSYERLATFFQNAVTHEFGEESPTAKPF
jgi:LysR family transcriptional regulator, hydrogen peroxide-inducible genes activator